MRSNGCVITLAIVLMACAQSQELATAARPGGLPRTEERITLREIQSSPAKPPNAYELVRLLRPLYLRDRGPQSFDPAAARQPVVYVDGIRLGEVASLRTIPTSAVLEISYLSPLEAAARWGANHPAGVIQVRTRRADGLGTTRRGEASRVAPALP